MPFRSRNAIICVDLLQISASLLSLLLSLLLRSRCLHLVSGGIAILCKAKVVIFARCFVRLKEGVSVTAPNPICALYAQSIKWIVCSLSISIATRAISIWIGPRIGCGVGRYQLTFYTYILNRITLDTQYLKVINYLGQVGEAAYFSFSKRFGTVGMGAVELLVLFIGTLRFYQIPYYCFCLRFPHKQNYRRRSENCDAHVCFVIDKVMDRDLSLRQ